MAWVVEFPPDIHRQRWVVALWMGSNPHVSVFPSVDDLLEVHGHLDASEVRWLDPDPFDADGAELLGAYSQPS